MSLEAIDPAPIGLPTLTLWQPWASLVVDAKVKRIETRSWAAPANLIGRYVGIHAAARAPEVGLRLGPGGAVVDEEFLVSRSADRYRLLDLCNETSWPLPLGALTGTARLDSCRPMVEDLGPAGDGTRDVPPALLLSGPDGHMWLAPEGADVERERPYGLFEPGRFAWVLSDVASTSERCPTCRNQFEGRMPGHYYGSTSWVPCQTCRGVGSCDPIPARGRQRVWSWTPEAPS